MIQRIQSIWMVLASITIFLMLFIPIAETIAGTKEFWIQATGLYQHENGVTSKLESFRPLYISVIALAIMCVANIFNFRRRTLQKRICLLAIVLIFGLAFWSFEYAQQIPGGVDNAKFSVGAFLPMIAVIFCGLSIRGIRKDEQLLRSAERLR
ncbi:MAG: DUF4293 family protein [Pedobacter sp.]|nr:MAG: DUF4293 family protein [Pedobacter sp.]